MAFGREFDLPDTDLLTTPKQRVTQTDAHTLHAMSRQLETVLADFGVSLPDDVNISVWDSTSEMRYLVLPMRPAGTDGWSAERLASLVTRDAMIGVGLPRQPEASA